MIFCKELTTAFRTPVKQAVNIIILAVTWVVLTGAFFAFSFGVIFVYAEPESHKILEGAAAIDAQDVISIINLGAELLRISGVIAATVMMVGELIRLEGLSATRIKYRSQSEQE